MTSAQKKNIIIKLTIIIIVVGVVLAYLLSMRAKADSPDGDVTGDYTVTFYVGDVIFDESENKGASTTVPIPRMENNYFTGWFLDKALTSLYLPGAWVGKDLSVYAGFRTFYDVMSEFTQGETDMMYLITGTDFSIEYDAKKKTLSLFDEDLNWYDLFLEIGIFEGSVITVKIDYTDFTMDGFPQFAGAIEILIHELAEKYNYSF